MKKNNLRILSRTHEHHYHKFSILIVSKKHIKINHSEPILLSIKNMNFDRYRNLSSQVCCNTHISHFKSIHIHLCRLSIQFLQSCITNSFTLGRPHNFLHHGNWYIQILISPHSCSMFNGTLNCNYHHLFLSYSDIILQCKNLEHNRGLYKAFLHKFSSILDIQKSLNSLEQKYLLKFST